jgi:hypothetical protein
VERVSGVIVAVDLWTAAPSSALPTCRHRRLGILLALGAVFGGIAGYLFWTNQDVWTRGENGWATMVAGFTGATTGALAALATHLLKEHSTEAAALKAAAEGGTTAAGSTKPAARPVGDDGF